MIFQIDGVFLFFYFYRQVLAYQLDREVANSHGRLSGFIGVLSDRSGITVLYHRLTVLHVFLYAVRRMSLDSWAPNCPGSGNILFQRRMSSF